MSGQTAFDDCSGRVFGLASAKRPSLQALHTLPDGIRHQVHLANDVPETFADDLLIHESLPALRWQRIHEVVGFSSIYFALSACKRARNLPDSHPPIIVGSRRDIASLRPEEIGKHIPPASVTLIEGNRRTERLWAAEQCLAAKAQAIVVLMIDHGLNLSESRTLQIAAERGGSLGLALISGKARSSACQTRWSCDPVPGGWDWSLVKNKTGTVGAWRVREGPDGGIEPPISLSSLSPLSEPPSHVTSPHSASVVSLPPSGSPAPR